jgi:hypothetical protein
MCTIYWPEAMKPAMSTNSLEDHQLGLFRSSRWEDEASSLLRLRQRGGLVLG